MICKHDMAHMFMAILPSLMKSELFFFHYSNISEFLFLITGSANNAKHDPHVDPHYCEDNGPMFMAVSLSFMKLGLLFSHYNIFILTIVVVNLAIQDIKRT